MSTLGHYIRDRRLALHLTQEELEERTGLSQNYISQVERGEIARPRVDKLTRFAEGLRVPVDDLKAAQMGLNLPEPAVGAVDLVPVPFYGWVPADTVRWCASEEEGATVSVPPRWFGGRSPQDFFIVRASGDCMLARGIAHGDHVLARWLRDREPCDNEVVIVRLGDERSLKVWGREGDTILLRDGAGIVVRRVNPDTEEITVLGVHVAHWCEPEDELGELL